MRSKSPSSVAVATFKTTRNNNYDDYIKPCFDINIKTDRALENHGLHLVTGMLQPVLDKLRGQTGHEVYMHEVVADTDHRRLPDGKYKCSYHIIIPAFKIQVSSMLAFYDTCCLPEVVDKAPFTMRLGGRRLWRCTGSSKQGSFTFFKPTPLDPLQPHKHPFHSHLMSYLTGNEIDISELFPSPDSRPLRRQRTEASPVTYPIRVQNRPLVRAPFLSNVSDGTLSRLASHQLESHHIDCDFGNNKLEGNRVYYECGPNGRKCMHGRHHDHNRFYVEFTRAGDMMMHCFSQQCAEPLKLGQWVSDVRQLLDGDLPNR